MGRRNKYESHVKPYLAQILSWRRDGATVQQIADELKVNRTVFYRYRQKYEELDKVLDEAETQLHHDIANIAENSLKAKLEDRMVVVEEMVEEFKDDKGKVTRSHKIARRKLIVADTTAVIFALKARRPEVWDSDAHDINAKRIEKINADIAGETDEATAAILERLAGYSDSGDDE